MFEVLPAMHALTGREITSEFGAGIKAEPVMYIKDFGRDQTNVQDCLHNTEKYLVQVLHRGNHGIETMDCLRCSMYHYRKSMTIPDLPQPAMRRNVIFIGHSIWPICKSTIYEISR